MRTDAKIGFAIGAVLLAVLTVYAIVVPKHSKKSANTVSLVVTPPAPSPSSATDNSATTTPPTVAAADNGTPTPTPAPAPVKDTTPVPAPVPMTGGPVADNTAITPPDGFHPLSDLAPKADDQKPAKLVDGVYTPAHKTAKIKHESSANALPDDADASSANDTVYTVKPGQTLSKIAYEVYGNSRFWVVIQRENKGLDSKHLKVGTKIKLPDISSVLPGPVTVSDEEVAPMAASTAVVSHHAAEHNTEIASSGHTYTVKSGDSLYGIAKRVLGSGKKADALYAMNKDVIGPDESKLKLGMVLKLPENVKVAASN